MKTTHTLIGITIFLIAFTLYLTPILTNPLPFGDVDSSGHFALAEHLRTNGNVSNLPFYLNQSYGFANNGKLWYPPQYHLNAGLIQYLTNSKFIAPYAYFAFTSALFIFTTFLLVYELFGFAPALITELFLIISKRDYLTYLWGLWPEKASYALTPLVILCFYKYFKNKQPLWIYLTGLVGVTQFYLHPQGLIHSLTITTLFFAYTIYKEKKWFSIKHFAITLLISAALIIPFATGTLSISDTSLINQGTFQISRIIQWNPPVPYTPEFANTKQIYGTVIYYLIIIGIIITILKLFKKEENKDNHTLLLCWLTALYILMHLDLIGIGGRIHRSLNEEAHLFYILAALTIYHTYQFIKERPQKTFTKWAVPTAIIITILFTFGTQAFTEYTTLKQAYPEQYRINEEELRFCQWYTTYSQPTDNTLLIGVPVYSKRKWIQAICHKRMIFDDKTIIGAYTEDPTPPTHVLFNYNDIPPNTKEEMNKFEKQLYTNQTPIFSSPNMRLYNAR